MGLNVINDNLCQEQTDKIRNIFCDIFMQMGWPCVAIVILSNFIEYWIYGSEIRDDNFR